MKFEQIIVHEQGFVRRLRCHELMRAFPKTFCSNDELLTRCVLAPLYANSKSDFVLYLTTNDPGCCLSAVFLQYKLKLEHQIWQALAQGAWHVVEGLQEIGFGFRALLEF